MEICKIEDEENSQGRLPLEENAEERVNASVGTDVEKIESKKHEVTVAETNEKTETIIDKERSSENSESEETQETQEDCESESGGSFICGSEDDMSECEMNNGSNSEVSLWSCLLSPYQLSCPLVDLLT